MRRAAAQLLDRLGPVDFQVATFAALTGWGGVANNERLCW